MNKNRLISFDYFYYDGIFRSAKSRIVKLNFFLTKLKKLIKINKCFNSNEIYKINNNYKIRDEIFVYNRFLAFFKFVFC